MNRETLKYLINNSESEMLEFKQTFNKSVIETLVAFSNTRGGSVLVGISDDEHVVGVSINNETLRKWIDEIKQNTILAIFLIVGCT